LHLSSLAKADILHQGSIQINQVGPAEDPLAGISKLPQGSELKRGGVEPLGRVVVSRNLQRHAVNDVWPVRVS
jgi:hypothetical protein